MDELIEALAPFTDLVNRILTVVERLTTRIEGLDVRIEVLELEALNRRPAPTGDEPD